MEATVRASQLLSEVRAINQARGAYAANELDQRGYMEALDERVRVIKEMTKSKSLMKLITVNLPGGFEAKIDYGGDLEKETLAAARLVEREGNETSLATRGDTHFMFSKLFDQFLSHKVQKKALSQNMVEDYARSYEAIVEIMGDLPVATIKRRDLKNALESCADLPKRNLKPYKGKTVKELLEMDIPDEHRISGKTVDNIKKVLQGVFSYAVQEEILQDSPARDLKLNLPKDNTYAAFADSEVAKILQACYEERKVWKKWIVMLAAYTGGRRGELVQLRKQDIKFDEESNRHYILITDKAGSVKTGNAIRQVPIHRTLIKAGFLDFVTASEDKLFPNLKPNAVTNWFARKREKLAITALDDYENRKVFHSFRHSVITKAQAAKNPTTHVQQVVGHEKNSNGVTDRYTHTLPLKDVLSVIDDIDYGEWLNQT
jgi:integrase